MGWAVVLAGVQKGGTSSLAELMMNHSGVCMSKLGKETHFHDKVGPGRCQEQEARVDMHDAELLRQP